MNWQDTVLSEESILNIIRCKVHNAMTDRKGVGKSIAKVQAEASFKAGQEVGKQEVVDWITNCGRIGVLELGLHITLTEWQTKLKEWGIKE